MVVNGSEEGSRAAEIVRQEDGVHRHDQVYDNFELRDNTPQISAQSPPYGLAESSSAYSANRAVRIIESTPNTSVDTVGARRKDGPTAGKRHSSPQGVPTGDSRTTTSSPMSSDSSRDMKSTFSGPEAAADTIIIPPRIPRTRDRGFSLRRTIFARHISEKAQASGSELELQPGLHFEKHQGPLHPGMEAQSDNKKPRTAITVVPVQEDPKQWKPNKKQNHTSFLPHYDTWVKGLTFLENSNAHMKRLSNSSSAFMTFRLPRMDAISSSMPVGSNRSLMREQGESIWTIQFDRASTLSGISCLANSLHSSQN